MNSTVVQCTFVDQCVHWLLEYVFFVCCTDIDECESGPCQHGGNCTEFLNVYNCSCSEQYMGINCELGEYIYTPNL